MRCIFEYLKLSSRLWFDFFSFFIKRRTEVWCPPGSSSIHGFSCWLLYFSEWNHRFFTSQGVHANSPNFHHISLWPVHSNIQFPLASRSTHCAVTSKNIYSHSVPSDISGDQRWAVSTAEPQEPRPLSLLDPLSSGFDHNRWSIIINQVLWLPLIRGDVSQSVVLGNQGSQAAFASFDLKKHLPS